MRTVIPMVTSQVNRTVKLPSKDAVDRAIRLGQDYFRRNQAPEGYWCGQLESNTTMEAEYLMLSQFLGRVDRERWRKLANYILSKQREDGSWGQYFEAPGDLSTSVESYFALKLAGHSPDSEPLRKARQFILSRGGVPRVRVFTTIWLALFGQWEWRGTPNMPPELIFLPSWAPFNIYRFASWARATIVPMLIILTDRPTCPVPASANIDELYPPAPQRDRLFSAEAYWWLGLVQDIVPPGPHRRSLSPFAGPPVPEARRKENCCLDIGTSRGRWLLGRHPTAVGVCADRPSPPGRSFKRRSGGERICWI